MTAAIRQSVIVHSNATLTAADRCDRCGARAYVRVNLITGGELLFCAHHGRQHLPKLQGLAATIQNETAKLAPDPKQPSPVR